MDPQSKRPLEDAAREAVNLQAGHRSQPKDQALLKALSKDSSPERQDASTSDARRRQSDRELIDQIRAQHPELTEEEVIRELELHGGI
jgi:hypothetical protein